MIKIVNNDTPLSKEVNVLHMKVGDSIRITSGLDRNEGEILVKTFSNYFILTKPGITWGALRDVWGIPVDLEVKVIEK